MTHGRVTLFAVLALAFTSWSPLASGQDVKQLKEKGDVPGLMRLLRHRDGKVRSSASVALSGAIRQVDDSKALARHVLPLVDVTIRDPYLTVREYAGRALQHCLQNVTDASILARAVPPMIDALQAGEVDDKRRRSCAVQLSRVIPKIKHEPLLVESLPMLLSATIEDPDETVREYAGRALKSALPRVRDRDTMHAGAVTLARTLQHKDVKRRRYAAVLLSWLVAKVTDTDTLRAISGRASDAAEKDSDKDVREYAGRAARDIGRRLQATAEKAET